MKSEHGGSQVEIIFICYGDTTTSVKDPAHAANILEDLFADGEDPTWSTDTTWMRDQVAGGLPDRYHGRAYASWGYSR